MTGGNGRLWLMVPELGYPVDPCYDYEFIPDGVKLYMKELTPIQWDYCRREFHDQLKFPSKDGFIIELDNKGARWHPGLTESFMVNMMMERKTFSSSVFIDGNSLNFIYYDQGNPVMEELLNKRPAWKKHAKPIRSKS